MSPPLRSLSVVSQPEILAAISIIPSIQGFPAKTPICRELERISACSPSTELGIWTSLLMDPSFGRLTRFHGGFRACANIDLSTSNPIPDPAGGVVGRGRGRRMNSAQPHLQRVQGSRAPCAQRPSFLMRGCPGLSAFFKTLTTECVPRVKRSSCEESCVNLRSRC